MLGKKEQDYIAQNAFINAFGTLAGKKRMQDD
ncbi:hypothetical protein Vi05172_g4134 [Venturia inaequalis]|nr:hypothetical protein Vi05172_g4134 [Venturia inaequalis]